MFGTTPVRAIAAVVTAGIKLSALSLAQLAPESCDTPQATPLLRLRQRGRVRVLFVCLIFVVRGATDGPSFRVLYV
jgi:hypothetical protein